TAAFSHLTRRCAAARIRRGGYSAPVEFRRPNRGDHRCDGRIDPNHGLPDSGKSGLNQSGVQVPNRHSGGLMEPNALVECAYELMRVLKEELAERRTVQPAFILLHDRDCEL